MAAIRPTGRRSRTTSDPIGSPVPRRMTTGTRLVTSMKVSRTSAEMTRESSSPRSWTLYPAEAGRQTCAEPAAARSGRRAHLCRLGRLHQLRQDADDQRVGPARLELLAI